MGSGTVHLISAASAAPDECTEAVWDIDGQLEASSCTVFVLP